MSDPYEDGFLSIEEARFIEARTFDPDVVAAAYGVPQAEIVYAEPVGGWRSRAWHWFAKSQQMWCRCFGHEELATYRLLGDLKDSQLCRRCGKWFPGQSA